MDMGIDSLQLRQQEFENWVRTVRDPAMDSSEGLRRIEAKNQRAIAEYEIARISTESWAIRINLAYQCGDSSGHGVPWSTFPSRELCIDFFLSLARRHFQPPQHPFSSDAQRVAQKEMSELLEDGLFGFSEPSPFVRV